MGREEGKVKRKCKGKRKLQKMDIIKQLWLRSKHELPAARHDKHLLTCSQAYRSAPMALLRLQGSAPAGAAPLACLSFFGD